ncbi:MAG TPA: DNA translocase FtsK 4TM domain-containing protein, partial [Opitutales bacterium]|nr:DNA translocase FtsK 4TM domain-containing protein [Opitutales bacterium]
MAQARHSEENPRFGVKEKRLHAVWAIVFLVAGLLWAVALWDYDWRQNPAFRDPVMGQNKIGVVGLFLASQSLSILGRGAMVIPAFLLWMSGMLFARQSRKLILGRFVAWVGLFFAIPILFDLWYVHELSLRPEFFRNNEEFHNYYQFGYGGWLGHALYSGLLHKILGSLGTLVVFGALMCVTAVFVFFDNLGVILKHLWAISWKGLMQAYDRLNAFLAARDEKKRIEAIQRQEERRAMMEAVAAQRESAAAAEEAARNAPEAIPQTSAIDSARASSDELMSPEEALRKLESEPPKKSRAAKLKLDDAAPSEALEPPPEPVESEPEPQPAPKSVRGIKLDASDIPAEPKGLRIVVEEKPRKAAIAQPLKKGDYEFPTLDLLAVPPPPPPSDDENTHQMVADQLVRTLAEFGVKVTMGEVHPGPVITRYDLYPAAGVRVEKIQNLDKNLALALCAMSVRILAPVPGKGCVGVEIPNKSPQSVFIRDILESEDWVRSKAEIPIALGKEVSGRPLVADLTKMPHMLIAGATGSGKTVCINSIVASLLYKMSPEDLRFVMVDPKIVEMQVYNGLPHMLIPVVTDPRKVPGALKYLINEMERRYRLFAKEGVRNIAGFNAKRSKDKEAEEKARELDAALSPEERQAAQNAVIEVPRELDFEEAPAKLPYIVCIVNELADLMMVAPADVET